MFPQSQGFMNDNMNDFMSPFDTQFNSMMHPHLSAFPSQGHHVAPQQRSTIDDGIGHLRRNPPGRAPVHREPEVAHKTIKKGKKEEVHEKGNAQLGKESAKKQTYHEDRKELKKSKEQVHAKQEGSGSDSQRGTDHKRDESLSRKIQNTTNKQDSDLGKKMSKKADSGFEKKKSIQNYEDEINRRRAAPRHPNFLPQPRMPIYERENHPHYQHYQQIHQDSPFPGSAFFQDPFLTHPHLLHHDPSFDQLPPKQTSPPHLISPQFAQHQPHHISQLPSYQTQPEEYSPLHLYSPHHPHMASTSHFHIPHTPPPMEAPPFHISPFNHPAHHTPTPVHHLPIFYFQPGSPFGPAFPPPPLYSYDPNTPSIRRTDR